LKGGAIIQMIVLELSNDFSSALHVLLYCIDKETEVRREKFRRPGGDGDMVVLENCGCWRSGGAEH
jgi:hypothetical protein